MQTENKDNSKKPVGYGSSMQSDRLGNKTRPKDNEKLETEKIELENLDEEAKNIKSNNEA